MLGLGAISEFAISEEGSQSVVAATLIGTWSNVIACHSDQARIDCHKRDYSATYSSSERIEVGG